MDVFYRKEPRGKVIKDGRTYIKHAKVRRFGSRHKRTLIAVGLALLAAGICAVTASFLTRAPQPETPAENLGISG